MGGACSTPYPLPYCFSAPTSYAERARGVRRQLQQQQQLLVVDAVGIRRRHAVWSGEKLSVFGRQRAAEMKLRDWPHFASCVRTVAEADRFDGTSAGMRFDEHRPTAMMRHLVTLVELLMHNRSLINQQNLLEDLFPVLKWAYQRT